MIFHSSTIEAFVNIMKNLEAANDDLFHQYTKLYDLGKDNEVQEQHPHYWEAERQIEKARDAVSLLISDMLTRED